TWPSRPTRSPDESAPGRPTAAPELAPASAEIVETDRSDARFGVIDRGSRRHCVVPRCLRVLSESLCRSDPGTDFCGCPRCRVGTAVRGRAGGWGFGLAGRPRPDSSAPSVPSDAAGELERLPPGDRVEWMRFAGLRRAGRAPFPPGPNGDRPWLQPAHRLAGA